ncbi:hypothetical protein ACSBR2_030012 [Camellia fascicularis]
MQDNQIMKVKKSAIKSACIILEAQKVESKELSDICAKITTPFKSSTASPASNMHMEVANLVPKSSDKPLKGMNVVGHQSSKPLELQVEEENGNQAKVINDELNESERALIDGLKAPQEDLIVT